MMDGVDGRTRRTERERERRLGANETQVCVDARTGGRRGASVLTNCRCALMDGRADGEGATVLTEGQVTIMGGRRGASVLTEGRCALTNGVSGRTDGEGGEPRS